MRGPLVKGQKILFYFQGISANKKHEKIMLKFGGKISVFYLQNKLTGQQ